MTTSSRLTKQMKLHLLDTPSRYGVAHTEMVGDVAETVGGGQLHDSNGHPLLQSEGWPHADFLVCDVRGHLGNNVHEGGPVHARSLDSLFVGPGVQDYLLPQVTVGGMGLEPVLNGQVMPEHSNVHGILHGLVLVSHMEVGGPVQDTWWVQDVAGDPTQESQLLA